MTARVWPNSARLFVASALSFVALLLSSQLALAQFAQQGPKLVGTFAVGAPEQGWSVALSADGNTAIVGGPDDNSQAGAAVVYTRSGGVWTQQGSKLVGSGAVGNAQQGSSVALSADGNTAIVGGPTDNSNAGAAWVYTRSGGAWSQQGSKLVGLGAAGNAEQGWSVALSADGNTAILGGPDDNSQAGAAWVYTRSGGVWSQQGSKLVGTLAVGNAHQGVSVALSGDSNTAIVGGHADNSFAGAAWVYTRSGGVWTQQGSKLVGTGAVGTAFQGISVALSADGNTAIVGGNDDNNSGFGVGAAWVYTRSGGGWLQQGSKLVGTGAVGNASQGVSVSLSADGNTALVGGNTDDNTLFIGAAWVYTRSGGVWSQQGSKLVGTGRVGAGNQGTSVALSGDGNTAIEGGNNDDNSIGAVWVFVRVPTVTSIAPSSGTTLGGTPVTITGTNFTGATAVTIGGTAATAVAVVNSTTITAVTPAHTAGTVDVAVTTAAGASTGLSPYTYVTPAPTVTSIAPTSGTTLGGTPVTITGTNLTGATAVTIGGTAATAVTVVNSTTITAVTPAHTAGAVDVAVTTAGGTGTGSGLYTFVTPAPTVTSIAPTRGTTLGGTAVTITGTNLTGATAVTIGGTAATAVTVVNSTTITAVTPAHTAGTVDVAATTPGGTGTGTGLYTYVTPPTVTSIAPTSGTTLGGTPVTITGTNLTGATAVTIGGLAATSVTVVNATTITALTPAHAAGTVDVAVTTAGATGTGSGLYTYVTPAPTVTSVAPTIGTILGGTPVTITGTNLNGATAVTIGGLAATSVAVVNATTITAVTPAHAAGTVDVTVTTPGGTGTGSSLYTYVTVSFSTVSAKLTVSSFQPRFTLLADFTLGGASDGINPVTEAVTLAVNTFTTTIPPGSFTMTGPGDYAFVEVSNGVSLNVSIKHKSGNAYTFQATAQNINLIRTTNPATVTLIIGDDTGATRVRF
jgi:IPT/TIG domain